MKHNHTSTGNYCLKLVHAFPQQIQQQPVQTQQIQQPPMQAQHQQHALSQQIQKQPVQTQHQQQTQQQQHALPQQQPLQLQNQQQAYPPQARQQQNNAVIQQIPRQNRVDTLPKSLRYDGTDSWVAFQQKFNRCAEVKNWRPQESKDYLGW